MKKPKLNINLIGDLMPGNSTDMRPNAQQDPEEAPRPSSFEQPSFIKGPWIPNLLWIFLFLISGLVLLYLGFKK